MADHGTDVELYTDDDWDTAPILTREGISVAVGARSEGQDWPPTEVTCTIDDTTGDYNPLNATGTLYGLAGRNTPLRVTADGAILATVEVSTWSPKRSLGLTRYKRWTPVVGGGLLRRLQQGATPIKSSLTTFLPTLGVVAHWPFEEGKFAQSARSNVDGVGPMSFIGEFGFGADAGMPGAAALPVPPAGAIAQGLIPAAAYPSGWVTADRWTVTWAMRIPEAPAADTVVLEWQNTGTAKRYEVVVTTGLVVDVRAYSSAGAEMLSHPGIDLSLGGFDGERLVDVWLAWQVTLQDQGAGLWAVELAYSIVSEQRVGADSETLTLSINDIASADTGRPEGVVRVSGDGKIAFGHHAFYPNRPYITIPGLLPAFAGWNGERSTTRFLRLCDEAGIAAVLIGDESDGQRMGPQRVDTLVANLRDCVRTDDGILLEPPEDTAVGMRTGRSRYNQPAALSVSFTATHIAPELVPVLDDQNTRNDVTAARSSGSGYTLRQESGPLNVNNPADDPDGVGRYDTQVTVNPRDDSDLVHHAGWHLAKGTIHEPRYPGLTIDLDAAPALIAAVDALRLGDRIEITDLPDEWQYDTASLLVIGKQHTLPAKRRTCTLVTIPASVYEIGIVGANDGSTNLRGQAIDTDASTLAADLTTTDTTVSVTSADGVRWTTNADDWNTALNGGGLYLAVGGEKMRVSNIAGAGATQTFTVVRSLNGVVKTQDAGTPVHVWSPVRIGL